MGHITQETVKYIEEYFERDVTGGYPLTSWEKVQLARAWVERERLREALREIALAGMSGTGMESEEAIRDWHARRAWEFIGIAARALDPSPNAGVRKD